MNDFLSSIVARALKTVPVVTPRPVSRFEPAANRNAGFEEQAFEREDAPTHSRESGIPPSGRNSAVSFSPTRTQDMEKTVRETDPVSSPISNAAQLDDAIETKAPRATSARDREDFVKQPGSPARELPRNKREAIHQGHPALQPQPRAMAAPAPAPQVPTITPAIHVSIGRVEVRAIHRAEKPSVPRAVPEAPRMSLGAYLRGRQD